MNDFSKLETQLRKLRPTQPSPDLIERIEHELANETSTATAGVLPRERRLHFNWLSIGLGLAAATVLVLFALIQFERAPKQKGQIASTAQYPPVSSAETSAQFVATGLTQVVYHTRDEGVHFPTNSEQPMRRVRSHTSETLQWRNPKTGATLRISYPKEQVSLLPVSGQ
jgi:hypothetical protein